MYLFTAGSRYPGKETIGASSAYTYKNHNGDFSAAAKQLYADGYGTRRMPEFPKHTKRVEKVEKIEVKDVPSFPLDVFPNEIREYIEACGEISSNSVDFMGCSFLWACSLMIGNTIRIKESNNWSEPATIWTVLVGDRGVGKTPSMQNIIFPLQKMNAQKIRNYEKQKKDYENYESLSEQDKETHIEVEKPSYEQFILDDVTIEMLILMHSENKNGVGIVNDEIAQWFSMNKYKEKSTDIQKWLQIWSRAPVSVNRITRGSNYIDKPFVPVLGGIQPDILANFFTDTNVHSGFLDRILFTYPDLTVSKYTEREVSQDLINYYEDWCLKFYDMCRYSITYDDFSEVKPTDAPLTDEAKKEWIRIFNKLTEKQLSDDTPEFLKSMMAKQKSYVLRFALVINTITAFHNYGVVNKIEKDAILKAEKLSDYFIAMNEKMIMDNIIVAQTRDMLRNARGTNKDKIKELLENNPNAKQKDIATELKISKQAVSKCVKQLKDEGVL